MRTDQPPPIARFLLGRMLAPEDRESVVAELDELYALRCQRRAVSWSRSWYRRQVLQYAIQLLRHGRYRRRPNFLSSTRQSLGHMMETQLMELRHAARRLLRAPVFTVVSVLTVSIGIGAFTAIFGLVNTVLLKPMPYDRPEDLAWVWRDYQWIDFPRGWVSGIDVLEMRKQTDVFEEIVALFPSQTNISNADRTNPQLVDVIFTSHELLGMLGVPVAFGRDFAPEDDDPNTNATVILGHAFWRTVFGGDSNIVGSTVFLSAGPATVIGVAPEDFHFAAHRSLGDPVGADIYVNLQTDLSQLSPTGGGLAALVRLRPGVTVPQIESALVAAARVADDAMDNQGLRLWAIRLHDELTASSRPALLGLMGAAGFLLLVLTANLATLLLGRTAARDRELGIRAALGGGRKRVLWSVVSESLIVAGLGGVLGALLAVYGTELIVAMAPDNLARLAEVRVDATVLSMAALVTVIMVVAAGAIPALQGWSGDLIASLRDGVRSGGSLNAARMRSMLVVVQVALSLMLLVGAGLIAQAFRGLLRQDPGFDSSSTLTFRIPLPVAGYDPNGAVQFHAEFIERVRALPGVVHVGATSTLPLTGTTAQTDVSFPGAPGNIGDSDHDEPLIDYFRVTDDYFAAAGMRMLSGRAFNSTDTERLESAIIDDVLAERFFPNGNAVGSAIQIGDSIGTVVGVVDQPRFYNVHSDDRGQVFFSLAGLPIRGMSYAVRTRIIPETLVGSIRQVLREMDPVVPLATIRTFDAIVSDSVARERLSLTLIGGFALGALLLASVGLYGVVQHSVVRRTREMGVRIALGADTARVLRMVIGQGTRLVMVGAVIGMVGAAAAARLLTSVMYGVDASDPTVYVVVALVLALVATAASFVPALRATRIDPAETLRRE